MTNNIYAPTKIPPFNSSFDSNLARGLTDHVERFIKTGGLGEMPITAFPKKVQRIIRELNKCLLFPIDYSGAAVLAAFSAAIGNTHRVQVKRGFSAGAVLFIATVGRPGIIKSPVLKLLLSPIDKRDGESYQEFEHKLAEYERAISMSKKEREENGIADPERPSWPHTLIQDATPEALISCLKANPRGLLLYKDELIGWVKNFNRYSSGSEQEFWLEGWNQGTISADRKTSRSIRISPAFITVTGTLQPGVLEELAKDSRSNNGFIDRILFAYPNDVKKEGWNEAEVDESVLQDWNTIINRMFDVPMGTNSSGEPNPHHLHLTPDAKSLLLDWVKDNANTINNTSDERLAGIYTKLEAYSLRLSLILQLMRWACAEGKHDVIERESVEGALMLLEYFRGTAEKVHRMLFDSSPIDKEPVKVRGWYSQLGQQFSRKEAATLAITQDISERSCARLLNRKDLFAKLSHGNYEKLY